MGKIKKCCNKLKCRLLHPACKYGRMDLVERFVKRGCDFNAKDPSGMTPILVAASHSLTHVVRYLMEYEADVDGCTEEGLTLLHYAGRRLWFDVAEYAVSKGCDLDSKDRLGNTPLLMAASLPYRQEMVQYLIDCGADIEASDERGYTVLHYACRHRWLDVVESLVSKKCDLNKKVADCSGQTPLQIAALHSMDSSVVAYLIACGADVGIPSDSGYTLMHYACKSGTSELVEFLIKKELNVNVLSADRYNPLHLAVQEQHTNLFGCLLDAGADWNAKNYSGRTPFNMLLREPFFKLEAVVFFLEKGAYFQTDDSAAIASNPLLKESILQNSQLCTLSVINQLDGALRSVYKIPGYSARLPGFEKMKIGNKSDVVEDITESVEYEIQTRGYCDVPILKKPIGLASLCVLTLAKHYSQARTGSPANLPMNV